MKEALRQLHVPHSMGASLFLFATREELRTSDPLTHTWSDGNSRDVQGNRVKKVRDKVVKC